MPTFTTSLQRQNEAASAGIRAYPQLSGITNNAGFIDQFNRTTINPTGGYEIYVTAANNSGTVALSNGTSVLFTTGTTATNHARLSTDELIFERTGAGPDNDRKELQIAMTFRTQASVADLEIFIKDTYMWIRLLLIVAVAVGVNWTISEQIKKQHTQYHLDNCDVLKRYAYVQVKNSKKR